MRKKLFPRVLGALAFGALLGALGTSCQQPPTTCTTAHQYYAARFELTSGDPNSQCGGFKGDTLGMNTYFATGGLNGTPKFNVPSAAIRAQYGGIVFEGAQYYSDQVGDPVVVPGLEDDPKDPDDYDHMPNAVGDFKSGDPNAEDLCFVSKATAVIEIPELPALPEIPEVPAVPEVPEVPDDPNTPEDEYMECVPAMPAIPAIPAIPPTPPTTVRYEWTNAKWLVSANYQGTQFEADLKFTQDGCTAEYHVVALAPLIGCMSNKDCTAEGVGINPDFAVECDLDLEDPYNGIADVPAMPAMPAVPAVPDDPMTCADESEPAKEATEATEAQDWGLCVLAEKFPSLN